MNRQHKARIFETGPVGRWRTCGGTANILGETELVFRPDGSGTMTTWSLADGLTGEPLTWELCEPGVLVLSLACDGEEEEMTSIVRMAFRTHATDVGVFEVLGQEGSDGFWWLLDPLVWQGEDV